MRGLGVLVIAMLLLCTAPAHAHFKLLKPASWLNEDELGAPQKGSPCGPGDARPFIGDDVQPIPASDAVTTFHAGETITVEWEETVYHPGYFRIALARTGVADATGADFPDPVLTDSDACTYDQAAVQTGPHDNVLADGLFMAEEISSSNRSLMQAVTLPDEPCEECTLQVVQVMKEHGGSSCFYFHCAAIRILPAEGNSAGAGAVAGAGVAGAGAAGANASTDPGGCSVAYAATRGSARAAALCLLAVATAFRRRHRLRSL